jgi:dTDP-4-amino-4,6-dideoxygalactose transaminase
LIPFNRASFDGKELAHLASAIADGHVSGNGPFTKRAESILDQGHGSGTSLLTTSCTHALEMTARLIDLGPGDEVIVPSFSFVSSASAFMMTGARPVFGDVRADTLNLDPDLAEALITPRTRAICVVHYGGVGADPHRFAEIADRHDLALIEDNAHGLFGRCGGQTLGTFGSFSTLSFHETKNVTCGEGGALVVNDAQAVERAEILREKGTDRSKFLRGQVDKYTWVDIGSSWVLSDLLAAVLVGQLERIDEIQLRRTQLWDRYASDLEHWAHDQGVLMPSIPEDCEHTAHLFHLRLPSIDERDRFIAHLRSQDVVAVFHYQPLHLSRMGEKLGGRRGQCPATEHASDTLVRLPLFPSLSDADQERVLEAVTSFHL